MSVVTITKCHSVTATMKYLFEKQKKNQFRERVGAVYCSLGSVDDFCKCAAELNETFQRIEGYNLVQSFEKDEFDINKPEDVQTVNELGFELAYKLYKDSPFAVITHIDANSGCLHNHITVLNHNFETNKCITENRQFKQISYANDMLMKEKNLNVCKPNKLKNLDDTLKMKLDEAISRTDNFDDFVTLLNTEYAISVDAYDKKHQIKKSMSYHYTDSDGKSRKRRSSSISDNYTVEAILSRLKANTAPNKTKAVKEPVKASSEPVKALYKQTDLITKAFFAKPERLDCWACTNENDKLICDFAVSCYKTAESTKDLDLSDKLYKLCNSCYAYMSVTDRETFDKLTTAENRGLDKQYE